MLDPDNSVAIVNRAHEILSVSPDKWTKYEFARDSDDQTVLATSLKACSFCLVGALQRAHYELNGPDADTVDVRYIGAKALVFNVTQQFIDSYNDQNTYFDILDVLKRASQTSILLH